MKVYIFYREEYFYPVELKDDADARANAEANPGTLKVLDHCGRQVWENRLLSQKQLNKNYMPNLITVPSIVFEQGDIFEPEENAERPIQFQFYHGCVSLEQAGNEVLISNDHLEAFIKTLRKSFKESRDFLK